MARTILEAQLFLDGASLSPTGELLLTDSQRANMAMTGNPLTSRAEQNRRVMYANWLTTPLINVFREVDVPKESAGRMASFLKRYGLARIGHVLAYGRSFTSESIRIGPNTVSAIEAFLDGNAYGANWQDQPTMDDVAAVCPTLSDVPSACLQTCGFASKKEGMMGVLQISDTKSIGVIMRANVEELLAEDDIRKNIWVPEETSYDVVEAEIGSVYRTASQFSAEFALARQRVEYLGVVHKGTIEE